MRERAYAKINLALHVRARMPDGFHDIETLFAFAEDGDELSVAPSGLLSLEVRGPFAGDLGEPADNLVLRAAEALRRHYGVTQGAALTLDKALPVASGIGGGSADAAACLRLLARFWSLDADAEALIAIARPLGADIPACVRSQVARGEGKGDRLNSQDGSGLAGMPLLLVHPNRALSTASVFAAWDGVDHGDLPISSPLSVAIGGRNDLQAPACHMVPEIEQALGLLSHSRPIVARMSGSGATCFALFENPVRRDAAAGEIARAHPDWWQLPTRLR